MPRPSFTWTVVASNHVIQSVCNLCMRMVAASARSDLLHVIERVHHCASADLARIPPESVPVALAPAIRRIVRK